MILIPTLVSALLRPALVVVGVSLVIGGLAAYRAALIEDGRQEVRLEVAAAAEKAAIEQIANKAVAKAALTAAVAAEKLVYKTRIKEILVYVPSANTACPIDANFERLFNASGAPSTPSAE